MFILPYIIMAAALSLTLEAIDIFDTTLNKSERLKYTVYLEQAGFTWKEASDYCNEHHSHLAKLFSNTDHSDVLKISQNISGFAWIGGQLLDQTVWIDGVISSDINATSRDCYALNLEAANTDLTDAKEVSYQCTSTDKSSYCMNHVLCSSKGQCVETKHISLDGRCYFIEKLNQCENWFKAAKICRGRNARIGYYAELMKNVSVIRQLLPNLNEGSKETRIAIGKATNIWTVDNGGMTMMPMIWRNMQEPSRIPSAGSCRYTNGKCEVEPTLDCTRECNKTSTYFICKGEGDNIANSEDQRVTDISVADEQGSGQNEDANDEDEDVNDNEDVLDKTETYLIVVVCLLGVGLFVSGGMVIRHKIRKRQDRSRVPRIRERPLPVTPPRASRPTCPYMDEEEDMSLYDNRFVNRSVEGASNVRYSLTPRRSEPTDLRKTSIYELIPDITSSYNTDNEPRADVDNVTNMEETMQKSREGNSLISYGAPEELTYENPDAVGNTHPSKSTERTTSSVPDVKYGAMPEDEYYIPGQMTDDDFEKSTGHVTQNRDDEMDERITTDTVPHADGERLSTDRQPPMAVGIPIIRKMPLPDTSVPYSDANGPVCTKPTGSEIGFSGVLLVDNPNYTSFDGDHVDLGKSPMAVGIPIMKMPLPDTSVPYSNANHDPVYTKPTGSEIGFSGVLLVDNPNYASFDGDHVNLGKSPV